MNGNDLKSEIKKIVSTLNFAWIQTKPSLLYTYHKLALKSSDKTAHIDPPYDAPVHDLVSNTAICPSVMQEYLERKTIPSILPYIQSVAEATLRDKLQTQDKISQIIESLAKSNISRELASKARYWRITRNIIAHGTNKITKSTENEINRLTKSGAILFRNFGFWGPLIHIRPDDFSEGAKIPLTAEAVASPQEPSGQFFSCEAVAGESISIGMADLLAAAEVWADVIDSV